MKKSNLTWLDQAAVYHHEEAKRLASARKVAKSVQAKKLAQWYFDRARISRSVERTVIKGTFESL